MAYLVPGTTGIKYLKKFNAIRRTKEGMLYLTSVDPNSSNDAIEVSKYYEDGKSDAVGRDQKDYVEERLEMLNVQYFTGDGSTKAFTISSPVLNETRLALFLDGVKQQPFTDFSLSNGNQINFVLIPSASASIVVGVVKRRYYNNDSDKFQQINYSDDTTTSFLINSTSGDLVKRSKKGVTRSAETTDDFETFESTTASVATTTYQSAV